MPRTDRLVFPETPHHITQRGVNKQKVFFSDADRRTYLDLLRHQAPLAEVRLLAYCLMSNHVHLIAVPQETDSLAVLLRRVNGRYAQYLNARKHRTGHLWQNRYFSCAMNWPHLWSAMAYVERNPVRAGLIEEASRYRWSSARAHLEGRDQLRLLDMEFWSEQGGADWWHDLLERAQEDDELRRIRKATHTGRPIGLEPVRFPA